MNKLTNINQGFFTSIILAFRDLDSSLSKQIEIRKKERQLLPLLYFVCFMLLLSQLIQITSKVQEAPYFFVVTAVVVSHLFFLPIFIYALSFILHLVLKAFGAEASNFQTRLAVLWSLTLSTLIILSLSVMKVFMSGIIKVAFVVSAELIVVYIFSRNLSFASNFKNRNLFTIVITCIYFIPVIVINFS